MLFLLSTADTKLGRFDAHMLSPQDRMEIFAEGFAPQSRRYFQDDDGAYLPISKWKGVRRDNYNSPTSINWNDFCGIVAREMEGFFCVSALPDTMKVINLISTNFTGSIEFDALPKNLREFTMSGHQMSGSVDLTSLPEQIRKIEFSKRERSACEGFSGTICLTQLPAFLQILGLEDGSLTGTLNLQRLNKCLERLNVDKNIFEGSLDLSGLPASLFEINVGSNALSGTIDISSVPETLRYLCISENAFSGVLDLRKVRESLIVTTTSRSAALFRGAFDRSAPFSNPDLEVFHRPIKWTGSWQ